jgi:hypothetical protein
METLSDGDAQGWRHERDGLHVHAAVEDPRAPAAPPSAPAKAVGPDATPRGRHFPAVAGAWLASGPDATPRGRQSPAVAGAWLASDPDG